MSVKLTIYIPTYNRAELLKMQLESLVEALRHVDATRCEIIVSDNCSTDHTEAVVKSFDGLIKLSYSRNDTNVGPVKNFLKMPFLASGEFLWLLGDDDLVFPYSLREILVAFDKYPEIDGFIASHLVENETRRESIVASLKSGAEIHSSRWLFSPDVSFETLERFEYIFKYTKGGAPLNFLSNVILAKQRWLENESEIRRHCEAHEDLSDTITAGPHTCIWAKALVGRRVGVIRKPLVVGFIGNQSFLGKWDVLNFMCFLGMSDIYSELGADSDCVALYRNATLRNRSALERLLAADDPYTKQHFSLRKLVGNYGSALELMKSLQWILFKSKSVRARLSVMSTLVLTLLTRGRSTFNGLSALWKYDMMKMRGYGYQRQTRRLHLGAAKYFRAVVTGAGDASVMHPIYLKNPEYIQVGPTFKAGPGLRIEAYNRYRDVPYQPRIQIGKNVCFNYNCHVGCINLVKIGDDVLIGSNVLITDHQHGNIDNLDFSIPYCDQPLYSKGGVVIGNNVWIGENVSIMPGVEIGANSIIAANAVVTRSFPPYSVLAGVPAKLVKSLDMPAYAV